jgi:hypothetical protein
MRWSTTPLVLAFALTCIARASVAQDAVSCVDEVQRLDEGLPVIHDQASATAIAREPGARKGASLGEDQRRQVSALIEQARTAGEEGDGGRCMQSLAEARALLREAGFGSGEPGSASTDRSGTGLLGSGTPGMAGDAGLPAPPRGAGAATTGMGGEITDRGPAVESAGGAAGGAGTRAGGGAAGGAASGAAGGSGSGSGGGGSGGGGN